MLNSIIRFVLICVLSFFLLACATTRPPNTMTLAQKSYLEQGKRYFEEGYYKRAMHELLPLACDGIAEAQYAVGYMYYYGYGVAQDTDVGYFWIKRSANQGFAPAVQALALIERTDNKLVNPRNRWLDK
ncbi:sel1 repeat family protein [Aquicella lusitana]|uniref:Sel1 repeat-containing protein n=1 Tax=Aquicella lusitana TaxID=254246 RepID=A0A370G2K6_9COXI|nr:sel1 repeat family protein [Aquicella lusitana]RDI38058.1 Sel1 repeat-containing protein [Aquicella lusitana]VVC72642.1 hypothetical protein AQULUS_03560 [Aquicella lusitana]